MANSDLKIRAFVSYSHEDAKFARQVKRLLTAYGFDAFLAHEDIDLSQLWRDQILEALRVAALFLALLSENFVDSEWTSQEIGFVLSRPEVKIIPISLDGTVPFGFISHLQSRRIYEEGIADDFLLPPLVETFPRDIFPYLIKGVRAAISFREGETKLERLVPYFSYLISSEAKALAQACIENSQIWDATRCRKDYLPKLLRTQGKHMGPKNRRALQYQITNREWYRPEEH